MDISVKMIKKHALLRSARILRKLLEMQRRGNQTDCGPWLPLATCCPKPEKTPAVTSSAVQIIITIIL